MDNAEYRIRTMSLPELELAVDWAAKEGWNPGLDDAAIFYNTDPSGFLMGFLNGEPIASISVVKYEDNFAFLGFYIVKPEYRGRGYGYRLWQSGMATLNGRNVALDGVLAQVPNYQKTGFNLAWRNIRYATKGGSPVAPDMSDLLDLSCIPIDALVLYDRHFFPAGRRAFLEAWSRPKHGRAFAVLSNGVFSAYGVIRQCREGYKIGPLFADSPAIAEKLFLSLKSQVPESESVYLDIPECNPSALALVERYNMQKVFETARMYTASVPEINLPRTYGITSFELG